MRFSTVGFIICQITIVSQAEKFGTHHSPRIKGHEKEILDALESRYHSNQNYPDRDFSNYYTKLTKKEFDFPVEFKAPHFEARDYWRNKHDYSERRTFFEDLHYGLDDKTTSFPSFYRFMSSVFGSKNQVTSISPESINYNRNREPSFDPLLSFKPTEPNYIPPPKPIRASVIKLETITTSPIYPLFEEYKTTRKHYPQGRTILNHALIENSRIPQSFGFQPQKTVVKIRPLSISSTPEYVTSTTSKSIYSEFHNNHSQSIFKNYKEINYKYPESVQDQLPLLNLGEIEIPYVSEKSNPQIFANASVGSSFQRQSDYTGDFFPSSNLGAAKNVLALVDIRSFNSPGTNKEKTEWQNENLDELKLGLEMSTVKSFPGAVEKVKRPILKYTKKLTAQLDKSSVEKVANLTVQGFSKVDKESAKPHKPVNYLDVEDLINYEMDKLTKVSQAVLNTKTTEKQITISNPKLVQPVNLNDELSLDAKILKDTNWDGLIVLPNSTTTEAPKDATTLPATQYPETKFKLNNTAFWEVVEEQRKVPMIGSENTKETTTITDQRKFQTTTEFTEWPTTSQITEASNLDKTEVESTTQKIPEEGQWWLKNSFDTESSKPVRVDPEVYDKTILSNRTTLRKRYTRRPKMTNFTPYPTVEELQKKLTNRSHFSKRQKPNITLTFGNKNVLKNRQSFRKDEVIKFSDEDIRRKKIGKRRQVFKKITGSTSEKPIKND